MKESETRKPPLHTTTSLMSALLDVSGVFNSMIEEEKDPARIAMLKKQKAILKNAKGIGTDRTRGEIIKGLVDIKAIGKKGKSIVLTELGWDMYYVYPKKLRNVVFTARWEAQFEEIRKGRVNPKAFTAQIDKMVMDEFIPEILNPNPKIQKREKKAPVPKTKLENVSCPICGADVYETEKAWICSKAKISNGKRSGCKFIVSRNMEKTLGRKLGGVQDFTAFVNSTEENPLFAGKHYIWFDPSSKFMANVRWENATANKSSGDSTPKEDYQDMPAHDPYMNRDGVNIGKNEPDIGAPLKLVETPKTFRFGDAFIFKNVLGKPLTKKQAEALLTGEKVTVTREGKKGKYKAILKYIGDGKVDITFPSRGGGGGSAGSGSGNRKPKPKIHP